MKKQLLGRHDSLNETIKKNPNFLLFLSSFLWQSLNWTLKWITSMRLICSGNSITQILLTVLCKHQRARYLQITCASRMRIKTDIYDIVIYCHLTYYLIIRKCFRLFYLIFPKSKYYWRYTFFLTWDKKIVSKIKISFMLSFFLFSFFR